MSAQKPIRVLWVDDNADFRMLLVQIMKDYTGFETVGALSDANNLEDRVAELEPDVTVLDLSMPGRRPLDALRSAARRFPHVRFLVSSSFDDARAVEDAMSAGAAGYLIKEGDFDELTRAIRRVANGERVVPREGQV